MNPEIDFVTLLGRRAPARRCSRSRGPDADARAQGLLEIIMTRVTVPSARTSAFCRHRGREDEPWMGALEDNLDVLNKTDDEAGEWGRAATRDLIRSRIKVKSLNFMRGRTFINKFLVIDEAQNLTPKQMKTLVTRAGPAPRWCAWQHRADRHAVPHRGQLGLTYVVDRMKGWPTARTSP
jgi:PhoH-like ATPase